MSIMFIGAVVRWSPTHCARVRALVAQAWLPSMPKSHQTTVPSSMTVGRQLRASSQPRRGLRREEAAAYMGFSARKFDELIADGRMPKPKRIDGIVVWDIHQLDISFDALPDEGSTIGSSRTSSWD